MSKKGNFGIQPKSKKTPQVVEKGDALYKLSPQWSFSLCDMQHESWGISHNTAYLANMLARFKEWERVTWGDVLMPTAGRKSNTQSHPIPVGKLDKRAAKRLTELNLDSHDILYSLAITGKQRVWGIMIEETGIFQLLWYDAHHEIYPV